MGRQGAGDRQPQLDIWSQRAEVMGDPPPSWACAHYPAVPIGYLSSIPSSDLNLSPVLHIPFLLTGIVCGQVSTLPSRAVLHVGLLLASSMRTFSCSEQ